MRHPCEAEHVGRPRHSGGRSADHRGRVVGGGLLEHQLAPLPHGVRFHEQRGGRKVRLQLLPSWARRVPG